MRSMVITSCMWSTVTTPVDPTSMVSRRPIMVIIGDHDLFVLFFYKLFPKFLSLIKNVNTFVMYTIRKD